jgi:hypothetical protein
VCDYELELRVVVVIYGFLRCIAGSEAQVLCRFRDASRLCSHLYGTRQAAAYTCAWCSFTVVASR